MLRQDGFDHVFHESLPDPNTGMEVYQTFRGENAKARCCVELHLEDELGTLVMIVTTTETTTKKVSKKLSKIYQKHVKSKSDLRRRLQNRPYFNRKNKYPKSHRIFGRALSGPCNIKRSCERK